MTAAYTWLVVALAICAWMLPGICVYLVSRWRREAFGRNATTVEERSRAEASAESLLRDMLDASQYALLAERGYIDVPSPSRPERVYRIPRGVGRVRVYVHGQPVVELCVQPAVALPVADVILAHKFMIEGNEGKYLANANEVPLALPPASYSARPWSALF